MKKSLKWENGEDAGPRYIHFVPSTPCLSEIKERFYTLHQNFTCAPAKLRAECGGAWSSTRRTAATNHPCLRDGVNQIEHGSGKDFCEKLRKPQHVRCSGNSISIRHIIMQMQSPPAAPAPPMRDFSMASPMVWWAEEQE